MIAVETNIHWWYKQKLLQVWTLMKKKLRRSYMREDPLYDERYPATKNLKLPYCNSAHITMMLRFLHQ